MTGERVTGKQELRIWAGLETTLIYCVHLSMNCIHAMHSIMSLAPDPAVEIVTAAFLQPSYEGADYPACQALGQQFHTCITGRGKEYGFRYVCYNERFDRQSSVVVNCEVVRSLEVCM